VGKRGGAPPLDPAKSGARLRATGIALGARHLRNRGLGKLAPVGEGKALAWLFQRNFVIDPALFTKPAYEGV
jgi:hypothetical protein